MSNYDCCLIICHGLSELIFVEDIKSNLRLKLKTYADNNGRKSIQITSLDKLFKTRNFSSLRNFQNAYNIRVVGGKILNFKVFIMMDFDEEEYTPQIKNDFLTKRMFKSHFLYDYIVPIFSIENFDDIMSLAGFKIDRKKKRQSYQKIFPGKRGDFARFKEITAHISRVIKKRTNIMKLLSYLEEQYNAKEHY